MSFLFTEPSQLSLKRGLTRIGLVTCLFLAAGNVSSQDREEFRTTVKTYLQSLDESFAYRYLDQELFLLDIIASVRDEYSYRADKKIPVPNDESAGAFVRTAARDSVRQRLKEVRELIDVMKKKNVMSPGYKDQNGLNDLHMEYQRIYAMDFGMTKLNTMAIRGRLLKSGDQNDLRRLFDRQVKTAFRRYKEASYLTAALELRDAYETFQSSFTEWDDIVYYIGDSYFRMKDFDNAEVYLAKLANDFPASPYVEKALHTLVVISYVLDDRSKMQKYFTEFETKAPVRPKDDNHYNHAFYLAGLTFFATTDFNASMNALKKIPATSRYYYPAKYAIAHGYANQDQFTEALEEFESVMKLEPNNPKFNVDDQRRLKDLSKLKASFIKFEQSVNGQKFKAAQPYIKQISKSSEYHDAALLLSAWASFKDNDIDTARIFADSLVNTYPASEYLFETKTLVGNLQVLDPNLSDRDRELFAKESYNYVAEATEAKYLSDQFILERDSSLRVMSMLQDVKIQARLRNDESSYQKYDRMQSELEHAIESNGFNRQRSSKSPGFYQAMNLLVAKIRVTEGRIKEARDRGDKREEERLNKELSDQLNKFQQIGAERYVESTRPDSAALTSETLQQVEIENYFAQHKVPRSISEIEARNRSFVVLREKIAREKQLIQSQLVFVDELMASAKEKNNQSATLKIEFERTKLMNLYYRLSDYEVVLYSEQPIESYVDLDTWGDFASYGRNNINYVLNTTKNEQIGDIGKAISQIDKILATRKKSYEIKIAQLEEEIKMQQKVIEEKELRERRAEQKTFFEKEYFQAKETEKPENDPYDYKDVVPEVIIIDDKPIEVPQEQVEEQEEELPLESAPADSTKPANDSAPTETPADPAVPAPDDGAKTDSSGTSGGGGLRDEAAIFLMKEQIRELPALAIIGFTRCERLAIQSRKNLIS